MANAITVFRMAAGSVLLFCPVFSPAFYAFYIAAGLSDMLDGFVSRKTNTVSKFGARLDTIADYVFVIVCLIKMLPVIRLPIWLYVWIGIITLIKAANIISGFAVQKTFMAVHSAMNKATGVLLFLLPLTIHVVPLKHSAIVVCTAATFAAIQEATICLGVFQHGTGLRRAGDDKDIRPPLIENEEQRSGGRQDYYASRS